ncbi:unnamed protein product [Pseudo-nitzschia multistriata]|uniref:Aminotransferase class I/classII large domain-containing protein n=1 Tax=Pseudo-nitzschia multistriata TaxID=183589 RepID=A0A448ZGJ4_9STRA|nr:unnamed protein product [Pseudo-nitzschia multistriata]
MPRDFSPERSISIVSAVLFGLAARWTVRNIRRERIRKARSGWAIYYPGEDDDDDNDDGSSSSNNAGAARVSRRCRNALSPATPYLASFLRGLAYACSPDDAPDGYVLLCMAENKLLIDLLSQRLQTPSTTVAAFSNPMVYCYNSFLGLPVARQAVSYFLANRFLYAPAESGSGAGEGRHFRGPSPIMAGTTAGTARVSLPQALQSINPAHIGIGSGAAGILNALFFLLGDEGDACLIPAPYYAAFESDLRIVARVVPFAVHMADPASGPSASELDLAFIEAKSQRLNPRFLLITNPNNPLGVVYSSTIMRNAVAWARKRKVHTIVDEIYALSTHRRHGHGFESIISILDNRLGNDVHFVWSVSKDFGASGLRFGVVYSQNETLLEGLANLNVFSGVSNPIQMVVSELLTDDDFLDTYLDESRARLRRSYHICIEKLEEMVLPFVPAVAGQFVYVDFSSLLPQKTTEWEQKLSALLIDHARLVLTPGESQRERTPGMFRICYAWVTPEVLEIGMERLSRIVAKIRRMDWSDLNESTLSGVII